MRLPKIPYTMNKNKSQTVPLGNINFCAATSDGDLVDSCGISARKYPYMTTRGAVGEITFDDALSGKITDTYFFGGGEVYVCDNSLYWIKTVDGEKQTYNLGTIEPGKKQFIPINTKLVILPDKVYLDSTDTYPVLHNLRASFSGLTRVPDNVTSRLSRPIPEVLNNEKSSISTYGKFSGNKFIPMVENVLVGEDPLVEMLRNEEGTDFSTVTYLGKATIKSPSDASSGSIYENASGYYISSDDFYVRMYDFLLYEDDSHNVYSAMVNPTLYVYTSKKYSYEDWYNNMTQMHIYKDDSQWGEGGFLEKDLRVYETEDGGYTTDEWYYKISLSSFNQDIGLHSTDELNIRFYNQETGQYKEIEYNEIRFELFGGKFESEEKISMYMPGNSDVIFPSDIDLKKKYNVQFGQSTAVTRGLNIKNIETGRVSFSSPVKVSANRIDLFRFSVYEDDRGSSADGIFSLPNDTKFRFKCDTSPNDDFCATKIGGCFPQTYVSKNFLPDDEVHWIKIYYTDQDASNVNFTDLFRVGDTVVAKSAYKDFGEKTFTITALTPGSMSTSADIFTPGDYPDMVIERRIPDLDFACECHNRLFGCSNADKTIYVSALGDPTNMMTYEGVSTDAFAVAVAGEGDFTACCAHDSSVLFWKENKLHKLTGYTPADFALYTYQVDGVQAGSEASAQIINEVLYYKGVRGVFAYTGGIPQLISQNFGERKFRGAVGGSDGDTYYISMSDADGDYLFAYETRSNMWVLEDGIKCDAFVRSDGSLKYLSGGKVYELTSGETPREHEWFMQLAPMYETMEGKKTYSRILLRVELPIGSYIIASVRMDGGRWLETGKIVGKTNNVVPIRIPINRCDKFELRLSGRGPCTILGIMREYYVGGDV